MKSERVRQVSPVENSGRQRIVTTARRHFFAYGFRAVTMDDLARELGMSKKTLYAHFPSKAALVEAVLLDKIRSVESDLQQITSGSSSDFLTTLHQLLARVQMHLEEIQPPFLRDLRREAPEMFALVETRRREMIHQYFGRLVGDGQVAGIIREDVPDQTDRRDPAWRHAGNYESGKAYGAGPYSKKWLFGHHHRDFPWCVHRNRESDTMIGSNADTTKSPLLHWLRIRGIGRPDQL